MPPPIDERYTSLRSPVWSFFTETELRVVDSARFITLLGDFLEARRPAQAKEFSLFVDEHAHMAATCVSALLDHYFAALTNFDFNRAYCGCDYPYNFLFPRGTHEGILFRLWVLVTDWEHDRVNNDSCCCASMSFCGATDRYPDMRAMGYPFDRPFAEPIEMALGSLPNAAGRRLQIRWHGTDGRSKRGHFSGGAGNDTRSRRTRD